MKLQSANCGQFPCQHSLLLVYDIIIRMSQIIICGSLSLCRYNSQQIARTDAKQDSWGPVSSLSLYLSIYPRSRNPSPALPNCDEENPVQFAAISQAVLGRPVFMQPERSLLYSRQHAIRRHSKPWIQYIKGVRGSVVVKALCYKPEGRGFETRWGEWFLSSYLILPAAPGPGVYSASNRNEYQKHKNNVSGE
jgi:hypothetical protein